MRCLVCMHLMAAGILLGSSSSTLRHSPSNLMPGCSHNRPNDLPSPRHTTICCAWHLATSEPCCFPQVFGVALATVGFILPWVGGARNPAFAHGIIGIMVYVLGLVQVSFHSPRHTLPDVHGRITSCLVTIAFIDNGSHQHPRPNLR